MMNFAVRIGQVCDGLKNFGYTWLDLTGGLHWQAANAEVGTYNGGASQTGVVTGGGYASTDLRAAGYPGRAQIFMPPEGDKLILGGGSQYNDELERLKTQLILEDKGFPRGSEQNPILSDPVVVTRKRMTPEEKAAFDKEEMEQINQNYFDLARQGKFNRWNEISNAWNGYDSIVDRVSKTWIAFNWVRPDALEYRAQLMQPKNIDAARLQNMFESPMAAVFAGITQMAGGDRESQFYASQTGLAVGGLGMARASIQQPLAFTGARRTLGTKTDTTALEIAEANYISSRGTEPMVTRALLEIAGENGGTMVGLDYRLKTINSLERKIEQSPGRTINDALRYTMTFDTDSFTANVQKTMDTLKNKEYKLQAMTNTFRDGAPYKGINSTYLSPDGELFELQFHTPESFDVKQNVNHILYEQQRILNRSNPLYDQLQLQMIENSALVPNPIGVEVIKSVKRN